MCVISMVHDHFKPIFPDPNSILIPSTSGQYVPSVTYPADFSQPQASMNDLHLMFENLRKVISDFHASIAAALVVDRLTGQPDCLNPEKKKLEIRVAELEKKLASYDAFVKSAKKTKKKIKQKIKSK